MVLLTPANDIEKSNIGIAYRGFYPKSIETDDLEILIREKEAAIKVEKIPLIDAIPGQIRQVFQNIISNALKFSKAGRKPEILIESKIIDEKSVSGKPSKTGNFCWISITDNGIGFNKKFAHTIFVLFHRLHSKDTYEGTGIGLAIAKKIIEKHQGIIAVEGEGAKFIIVPPIHQVKIVEP